MLYRTNESGSYGIYEKRGPEGEKGNIANTRHEPHFDFECLFLMTRFCIYISVQIRHRLR